VGERINRMWHECLCRGFAWVPAYGCVLAFEYYRDSRLMVAMA
jgi:hypothetical protein